MKYQNFLSTVTFILTILLPQSLFAHVMVAQHGTLNVLDNGVFMVLSLPVSAFSGIDDDNDGKLSSNEFSQHRTAIARVVHKKVVLKDNNGKLALEDMILSPVMPHQAPNAPASQLIVMGKYNLPDPASPLEYKVELFGKAPAEQLLKISANRKFDHKKQLAQLTPKSPSIIFF